jgi:hypothetical protein
LVSQGLPYNITKFLEFIRATVNFDDLANNYYLPLGLHHFIDVTKTSAYSHTFSRIGYKSQSLLTNMGLLCTMFFFIVIQAFAYLLMTIASNFFKSSNAVKKASSGLGKFLLP